MCSRPAPAPSQAQLYVWPSELGIGSGSSLYASALSPGTCLRPTNLVCSASNHVPNRTHPCPPPSQFRTALRIDPQSFEFVVSSACTLAMMWELGSGETVLSYSFLSGDQTHLPPRFPRVWQAGTEPGRRGGGNNGLLLSFCHRLQLTVSTAARNMTWRHNCKDFSLAQGFSLTFWTRYVFLMLGLSCAS